MADFDYGAPAPEALGDVVEEPLRLEMPIGKNDSH